MFLMHKVTSRSPPETHLFDNLNYTFAGANSLYIYKRHDGIRSCIVGNMLRMRNVIIGK